MIYLLRHGEIQAGPKKRFIGQTDCELSAKGRQQALAWKDFFSRGDLQNILCSDLQRSEQSAASIAGIRSDRLRIDDRLREIHLGDWENQEMAAVKAACPQAWVQRGQDLAGFRPPGGESFRDLRDRVMSCFEEVVCSLPEDILIVGHAGVNRVLLCRFLGMPLQNLFRLGQDYGCLNLIQQQGAQFRVLRVNVPHLFFDC